MKISYISLFVVIFGFIAPAAYANNTIDPYYYNEYNEKPLRFRVKKFLT